MQINLSSWRTLKLKFGSARCRPFGVRAVRPRAAAALQAGSVQGSTMDGSDHVSLR